MRDATWRRTGLPFGDAAHNQGHRKTNSLSRTAALRALGSVVYAARLADGTIKIGWTQDFENRMRHGRAWLTRGTAATAAHTVSCPA